MGSFVSGALNRHLFSSVTQNLFGFESAVARAAGAGVLPDLALPTDAARLIQTSHSWWGQGPVMGQGSQVTRNLIYTGMTDEAGVQYVAEIEASTGQVIAKKVISTGYVRDDHLGVSPFLIFHNAAGKLIVLSTGHGASGNGGVSDKVIRLQVSDTGRVADLVAKPNVANTFGNTNYMQGWRNGSAVLAMTCDDNNATWAALRSTDGGETFAQRQGFIGEAVAPGGGQNQLYLKSGLWSANRVLCFCTSHPSNHSISIRVIEIEITTGDVFTKDAAGVETNRGNIYATDERIPALYMPDIPAIETTNNTTSTRLLDVRSDGHAYITVESPVPGNSNGEYFLHILTGDNPYNPAAWSRVSLGMSGPALWTTYFAGCCFANEPHSGTRIYRARRVGGTSGTSYFERLDSSDNVNFTATLIEESTLELARPISPMGAKSTLPVIYQKLEYYTDFQNWSGIAKWSRSKLDPRTVAYFDGYTAVPDSTQQGYINALIVELMDIGADRWMEGIHLLAAHDRQAATRNLLKDQYHLSEVGSVDFLALRGSKSGGGVYETGFSPSTMPGFEQENASVLAYQIESGANSGNGAAVGMFVAGSPNAGLQLSTRRSSNVTLFQLNSSTTTSFANTDGKGYFFMRRLPTIGARLYIDDEAGVHFGVTPSSAIPAGTIKYLGGGISGVHDGGRIGFAGFGASPPDLKLAFVVKRAMQSYLTSVGAL